METSKNLSQNYSNYHLFYKCYPSYQIHQWKMHVCSEILIWKKAHHKFLLWLEPQYIASLSIHPHHDVSFRVCNIMQSIENSKSTDQSDWKHEVRSMQISPDSITSLKCFIYCLLFSIWYTFILWNVTRLPQYTFVRFTHFCISFILFHYPFIFNPISSCFIIK